MSRRGDRGDVEHLQAGIGGSLKEHDPGALVDRLGQLVDLFAAQKRRGDTDLGQVVAEQFECAAVDVANADDVFAPRREPVVDTVVAP